MLIVITHYALRMLMADREIPLSGGNVSTVVRVGDTVRRVPGPWTPTVHHFLRYLESQGFESAPQALGFDKQGREILTFMPGEISDYPLPTYMWTDATLVEVAALLRRFHDATLGYVPPEGAVWQLVHPDISRHEVICHNDFAPYNTVFQSEKPTALIDFDFAGPGPRVWDVAYAVYRFVPLSWEADMQTLGLSDLAAQGRRLRLFCDTYDLQKRDDLLDMVQGRLEYLCFYLTSGAANGNAACRKMVDEGHLALYQREIEAFRLHRPGPEESLS